MHSIDIAVRYGTHLGEMRGPLKCTNIVLARFECWAAAYKAGHSIPEIADFYHKDRTTVLAGLRRMGVISPRISKRELYKARADAGTMPTLDAKRLREALGMWRRGRNTAEIARAIRRSEAAVYNALSKVRNKRAPRA